MKFTLSWLREHLDTEASFDAILEGLTRVGLEVEDVEDPSRKLGAFRIARVLSAAPHPQADKLQVLSVDAGDGEPLQIVCGAPNARTGLVGVLGKPGDYVPGLDVTLKVAAIRGVESRGMMCSMRELELGESHDGIIDLPADAPIGEVYVDWAGLADPVIDVAITPNRQDCMGVRGIARDLAAAGLGTLKPLNIPTIAGQGECPIEIRTDDPEGCPAFFGRVVRGVVNGDSPEWLAKRLKAVGQRPISALVALETLKGRARVKRTMWSRRAQEYEAKINSGDIVAIAEVVRDLYRSESQPEQSYSERQLYEAALDRLSREIAAVQRITETEAVKEIEAALAKGPRRGPAKPEDEAVVEDEAA